MQRGQLIKKSRIRHCQRNIFIAKSEPSWKEWTTFNFLIPSENRQSTVWFSSHHLNHWIAWSMCGWRHSESLVSLYSENFHIADREREKYTTEKWDPAPLRGGFSAPDGWPGLQHFWCFCAASHGRLCDTADRPGEGLCNWMAFFLSRRPGVPLAACLWLLIRLVNRWWCFALLSLFNYTL